MCLCVHACVQKGGEYNLWGSLLSFYHVCQTCHQCWPQMSLPDEPCLWLKDLFFYRLTYHVLNWSNLGQFKAACYNDCNQKLWCGYCSFIYSISVQYFKSFWDFIHKYHTHIISASHFSSLQHLPCLHITTSQIYGHTFYNYYFYRHTHLTESI